MRTLPTKGYPVNEGFSCIKGLSLSKQQTTVKPDALPKIRQEDGSMKEVPWEEAWDHVAEKITGLQKSTDGKVSPASSGLIRNKWQKRIVRNGGV